MSQSAKSHTFFDLHGSKFVMLGTEETNNVMLFISTSTIIKLEFCLSSILDFIYMKKMFHGILRLIH